MRIKVTIEGMVSFEIEGSPEEIEQFKTVAKEVADGQGLKIEFKEVVALPLP